jgi:hypothetical protein
MKYFKRFEKQTPHRKRKWARISTGVILFPFIALALGFIAMLPK